MVSDSWAERHQVALYLLAIAVGGAVGLAAPRIAPALGSAVTPVLGALLFATFLGIPLIRVGRALTDVRFLAIVLTVNFVLAPVVAFALSRFVADDEALLLGLLLVLLTPCVDYVIVFAGLAGGARERLLAVTPVLMVLQVLLLPLYLLAFAGPGTVALIEPAPFVWAFASLILLPLGAAALLQRLGRRSGVVRGATSVVQRLTVPLVMATLALVVGSQIAAVGARAGALVPLVPLYAGFLAVMVVAGVVAGRLAGLDVPATRAVAFSGATRNSLVVLPLALALPASMSLSALAVVTQTLVELVGMAGLVRVLPRLTGSSR